jgi:hypothetical protein
VTENDAIGGSQLGDIYSERYARTLVIDSEILDLVAEPDEFKGAWRASSTLAPDRLSALRRGIRQLRKHLVLASNRSVQSALHRCEQVLSCLREITVFPHVFPNLRFCGVHTVLYLLQDMLDAR